MGRIKTAIVSFLISLFSLVFLTFLLALVSNDQVRLIEDQLYFPAIGCISLFVAIFVVLDVYDD
jgi:hypothetical protein